VVTVGVELVEDHAGDGAVFVWGNAAWFWAGGGEATRRLAAVQLVTTGTAGQREAAGAFGVKENTVWRWRRAYRCGGVAALAPRHRGPQGPSKLDAATVEDVASARGQGLSMKAVAERTGVSLNSVSRALKPPAGSPSQDTGDGEAEAAADDGAEDGGAVDGDGDGDGGAARGDADPGAATREVDETELVALARPAARTGEQQAARGGCWTRRPRTSPRGRGCRWPGR
jgi:transposase